MFGYVQPLKPELKMKEYEAFRGYYCGLCKTIKEKYSNAARFMLNYDCAVLSLLLSSMSDEAPAVKRERCIASPFKKKTVIRSGEAAYAAAVNVILGYGKIRDTAADEGKVSAHALSVLYHGTNKRAAKDCPALAGEFEKRMGGLKRLEAQKCASVDAVADEFAQLLGAVFSLAPFGYVEQDKKALRHFGYNLGRWIYIADALDDIEKDDKTGGYNVFLQRDYSSAASLRQSLREEATFSLHCSLAEACKAYELLNIKRDKPILDNIMYLGLAKKTEDVLKGDTNGSV